MGLWQNLVESYDKNADALKLTYPLSTTSISNNTDFIIVITIDKEGRFIKAYKIEKPKKDKDGKDILQSVQICLPVTEESMGRSSGPSPHPIFDQYEYLKGSGRKYDLFVEQLRKFADFVDAPEQVKAIYTYITRKTIADNLNDLFPKPKTNIIFEVQILGNPLTKAWENASIFEAWHRYYTSIRKENHLDFITGTMLPTAKFHPKKINSGKDTANAKLISDNDTANYTFRGKFENSQQAVSIGYESSQKAHQFLRYLINDRGYYCGEQVILSFTFGTIENSLPSPMDESKSIWDILKESHTRTDSDKQIDLRADTGFDYAETLKKSLAGFGYGKTLEQHTKTAVIALDAASKGRLSITFYRELDRSEYLEKIADWHSGCKWNQKFWDTESEKYIPYIGAPSVDKIIEAVHGKPRGRNDESFTKIKKAARERLLRCIFDGAYLPRDYVIASVRRASNPLGFTKDNKFDHNGFEQIVSTACALVRKYYQDQQSKKEDYKLSIEHERTDRDYLFGRLLGAADKLEEHALGKKKRDKNRVTAAIRYMQTFAQHPFRTWKTIHACLNPYIQEVKGDFAFNQIQSVMNQFMPNDFEKDVQLNGSYLIGYYHERAYIDSLVKAAGEKKQTTDNNEKENNNDGK